MHRRVGLIGWLRREHNIVRNNSQQQNRQELSDNRNLFSHKIVVLLLLLLPTLLVNALKIQGLNRPTTIPFPRNTRHITHLHTLVSSHTVLGIRSIRDRQDVVTYVDLLINAETTDARLTHLKGPTYPMGPIPGVARRSPNLSSPNYRID